MRRSGIVWLLLAGCEGSGIGAGLGTTPVGPGPTPTTPSTSTSTTTWAEEAQYTLQLDDTVPPALDLLLSKDEVSELLGPVADDVVLLELDSEPMLTSAMEAIKNACGTKWSLDNADPQHDCDLTALGQTFEGPDGTWESSAEYALVRLLTMTPANSDVAGTSIEGIQEIADYLGIGGGFAEILSDTLEIGRTDEFLDTSTVVASLQENLLATHPEMNGSSDISVTLADALEDLAPMGARLGPSGAHPGILDPAQPPSGQVLTDDFTMSLWMQSNLRVVDGVDLSVGKDYLAVVDDRTGPEFDDIAEFDFEDPAKFSMDGIAANPVVDLRFSLLEEPTWVPACVGDPACVTNLPATPIAATSVWSTDPWTLEHVIASGAYEKYLNLVHDQSYYLLFFIWVADVQVGQNGNPPGYAEFSVLLGLGNPPGEQYVWELLLEVAQQNLHEGESFDFDEGDANVAFTLTDIDVGMSAAEIEDAVRPVLQDQADDIATWLLGDFRKNSGDVDFVWRRLPDGEPALVFVAPEDLDPEADYPWKKPGFFADEALDDKLSDDDFDNVHEAWIPPAGESTVYVKDKDGELYRLRVFREGPNAETLDVLAAKVAE